MLGSAEKAERQAAPATAAGRRCDEDEVTQVSPSA